LKIYIKASVATFLSIVLLTGCSSTVTVSNDVANNEKDTVKTVKNSVYNDKNPPLEDNGENNAVKNENDKDENKDEHSETDIKKIKPNEAGQVMVLMYHSLGDKEKDYVRTVENFKEDLRLLYQKGYRLISLRDYINNEIDVEAGKTPVVLTVDDGNQSDFNIIQDNGKKKVDPNSIVGILEDFNKKYPDFGLEATFFINGGSNVFGQKDLIEYKLNYIIDNGMDIGNHSYGHENLGQKSEIEIQRTLAKNVEFIKKYLPDYEVNILSLPFGARPKNSEKRKYLYKGSYEGIRYNNIGALAVGWRPEYSAVHKEFDPLYIHRVHGSSAKFGIRYWLEYFDRHTDKRYISDGDKDIVTIPEKMMDKIDKNKLGSKKLRTYKLDEE
jgi:peptidoglycan/xylan/chitin deacetylase (PgdA/CDA1 family)